VTDLPAPGAIIVLAKAPTPGRVKTRLVPPCTPIEAARVAEAALAETLAAAQATRAGRRLVLCLEGEPGSWLWKGWSVLPQRGDGLGERLAAAFQDVGGPAVLIGMDTPQVVPAVLEAALQAVTTGPLEATLGMARDGGWWAIGLRRPDPRVFLGVPMGTTHTGRDQAERLQTLEYRWGELPILRDVDRFEDALAVAADIPDSGFARAVALVSARVVRSVRRGALTPTLVGQAGR
jgi:uncharacterized protein